MQGQRIALAHVLQVAYRGAAGLRVGRVLGRATEPQLCLRAPPVRGQRLGCHDRGEIPFGIGLRDGKGVPGNPGGLRRLAAIAQGARAQHKRRVIIRIALQQRLGQGQRDLRLPGLLGIQGGLPHLLRGQRASVLRRDQRRGANQAQNREEGIKA